MDEGRWRRRRRRRKRNRKEKKEKEEAEEKNNEEDEEMDTKRDRLVLAGIVTNSSGGYAHQILTAPLSSGIAAPADHGAAPADCAPFTKAGTFGIADYVPMLHSSAYDEDTQTLYVTVAPNKTAFALAVEASTVAPPRPRTAAGRLSAWPTTR